MRKCFLSMSSNCDGSMNMGGRAVSVVWRNMRDQDLSTVVAIADRIHLDYPEAPAIYAERLQLFAGGCQIAMATGGAVHGYAIAHPALLGQPPSLNTLLNALPVSANCLYLHDIALLPEGRQYGLGGTLIDYLKLLAQTMQLDYLALVAVNNSAPYWRRQGFAPYAGTDAGLRRKLASYHAAAEYLVLDLQA